MEETNLSPFLEPSQHMCQEITRQAELIFSDTSLGKDTFLLKHVRRNKEGFVNLKLLISAYKPIKRLTQDWRQIAFSIRECSSKLEINELGTKIRRLDQIPCYDPSIPSKTVVATNFPMSSPTIKDVVNMFSSYGEIVQVRILRPGNPTSGDVKRYLASNSHLEGRVSAFIEFESYDLAHRAVTDISERHHYNLEVYEYSEPPASRKDDKPGKDLKKIKKKQRTDSRHTTGKQNKSYASWGGGLADRADKWDKGREDLEQEGGEDDIGYSSDNEVIDNNEWTNLVNRTVAMVFEDV